MGAMALEIDPEMGGMIVLGIIGAIFVIALWWWQWSCCATARRRRETCETRSLPL